METEPLIAIPCPTPEDERRLADVAVLADGVVHDIRNPLNVIRSNLYLLRQRLDDAEPKVIRSLDRIDDQVTVALRLLEGLQAIYRSDSPQSQRVNLKELVVRLVESYTLPEGLSIQVEASDQLPLATGDPQLIDAVVRALIRNAQDSLMEPPGGRDGTITVRLHASDHEAAVTIEDAGPGFERDALDRAFEPFFTTRRSRSGLGLAVAAKVARALRGRLVVESRPGSGASVTLFIPTGRTKAIQPS